MKRYEFFIALILYIQEIKNHQHTMYDYLITYKG